MEEEYLNIDGFEFYRGDEKLSFSAPKSGTIGMDIPHQNIVDLNNYLKRVRSHVAEERQKGAIPSIILFSVQKYKFFDEFMNDVYGLPGSLKLYYNNTLIKPIGIENSDDDDYLGTSG